MQVNTLDFYHYASLASFALGALFALIAVILFFRLDIRSILQMRFHYLYAANKAASARRDAADPTSGHLGGLFGRKKKRNQEEEADEPSDAPEDSDELSPYNDDYGDEETDDMRRSRRDDYDDEDGRYPDDDGEEETDRLVTDRQKANARRNQPALEYEQPADGFVIRRKIKITHSDTEERSGSNAGKE